jgi:hypothetical protein
MDKRTMITSIVMMILISVLIFAAYFYVKYHG